MRKVLLVLAIFGVLFVGGDLVIGSIAEARLAEGVQNRLGLTERPDVDLQGFPFLLHVLRRRFPEVSVEARDVRVRGLVIERFVLRLSDARFDSTTTIAGGGGTLSASRAEGTVEVTQKGLGAYLERHDVPLRVELLRSSRARVSGTAVDLRADVEASAEGELAVTDGSLEFRPDYVRVEDVFLLGEDAVKTMSFQVQLPEVIPGMSYDGITVEEGRAILSFRLRGAVVPV